MHLNMLKDLMFVESVTMTDFKDLCFWNSRTYGSAIKIKQGTLMTIFVIGCLITPATNWIIPMVKKIIKRDIIIRYDTQR